MFLFFKIFYITYVFRYLFLFLKFVASVIPTIEYDYTLDFDLGRSSNWWEVNPIFILISPFLYVLKYSWLWYKWI